MRRLLSFALILTASPLLAFDYITPRAGPAPYSQSGRVASNGIDYLVAWTMSGTPIGSAIYTTVVRADGSPTDLGRWVQTTQPGGSETPQVNPHGISITPGRDGYFLSWVSDEGLSAAITDSFGRIEHRVTLPINSTSDKVSTLAAWNGAAHLVVTTSNGPFSAWLFDNNGDPLVRNLPIGNTYGDDVRLAVTADSTGFLVLSTKSAGDHQDLYGRRISPSGVPGEWFLIRSITPGAPGLAVTSEGSHDVIAWGTAFGIWTMQVDSQTNAATVARQLLPDAAPVRNILIAGGRTWITFEHPDHTVYAITLGSDGSQTAPLPIGGTPLYGSDLASNGTGVLSIGSDSQIRATFLTPASASASFEVTKTETDQEHGNLAAGSNQVLAVWDEQLTADRQIFAARFEPKGLLTDRAGFQISATANNVYPTAAFNGTNYLVVWTQQTGSTGWQVAGRRVSPEGKVLDSADIVIGDTTYYGQARVASDGTNWLVVSTRGISQTGCGNTGSAVRLFATRISPVGAVLDGSGVVVTTNNGEDQEEPDVAWTGSKYLITWRDYCAGFHQAFYSSIAAALASPDLSEIRTARVSAQGYVKPILAILLTTRPHRYSNPHVTGGSKGSLIAWEHTTSTDTTTEYVALDDTLPLMSNRHRVVTSKLSSPSLPGRLAGVGTDANGQNYVLTQMTVPWIAPPHQGIWQTLINPDGTSQPPVFRFYLENGESFTDDVVVSGGGHWVSSARFDPVAGAVRLQLRPF